MTRFLRFFPRICISLLFVAGLNGAASAGDALDEFISGATAGIDTYESGAQEEVENLISGAIAYIDMYESGRIAYTYEQENAPLGLPDKQIEDRVRDREMRLKKTNRTKEQISEFLKEFRATLEKRNNNWGKTSGNCEVVFEGDNQYLTNTLSDGTLLERYDYNGNSTEITHGIGIPIGSTKPPVHTRTAEVYYGQGTFTAVHSILDEYRYVRRVLVYPKRNWVFLGAKEEKGETVFVLSDTTSNSVHKFFLEIIPEKGYFIKKLGVGKKGHEPVWTERRFSNPIWNADAQIYYPGKVVLEIFNRNRRNSGQEALRSRRTLTQTDVRFTIDVPDKTFFVPVYSNFTIDDRRADSAKSYSSGKPDELRRFLRKLNGDAKGR